MVKRARSCETCIASFADTEIKTSDRNIYESDETGHELKASASNRRRTHTPSVNNSVMVPNGAVWCVIMRYGAVWCGIVVNSAV